MTHSRHKSSEKIFHCQIYRRFPDTLTLLRVGLDYTLNPSLIFARYLRAIVM